MHLDLVHFKFHEPSGQLSRLALKFILQIFNQTFLQLLLLDGVQLRLQVNDPFLELVSLRG